MDKKRRTEAFRHTVQTLWALFTNSYFMGFLQGKIYRGNLKRFCVPGMNCYSCPGALGACPIGALQAVIGSKQFLFSSYILGFICLFGIVMGRFVCGWLCPFGLIQELLHKIPMLKKIKTFRGDMFLRKLKYIILLVFVFLLPMFAVDIAGTASPYFCKLICPVGTLEGAVPLLLLQSSLRTAIGWLYAWKVIILIFIIFVSILIYRPFCKYLCPLGAIYAINNRISIFKYHIDKNLCINCGKCISVCQMNLNPRVDPNHHECIRCGKCKNICPSNAIEVCSLLCNKYTGCDKITETEK